MPVATSSFTSRSEQAAHSPAPGGGPPPALQAPRPPEAAASLSGSPSPSRNAARTESSIRYVSRRLILQKKTTDTKANECSTLNNLFLPRQRHFSKDPSAGGEVTQPPRHRRHYSVSSLTASRCPSAPCPPVTLFRTCLFQNHHPQLPAPAAAHKGSSGLPSFPTLPYAVPDGLTLCLRDLSQGISKF